MVSAYSLLLLAHVTGLILFAGTTIVGVFILSAFWKSVDNDLQKAKHIHGVATKLSRLTGIGFALLILSGIGLVSNSHGVVAEANWFRLKIGLVLLAIINGVVFGGRLVRKLTVILEQNESSPVLALRPRFRLFYTLQILILAGIVTLGVTKLF